MADQDQQTALLFNEAHKWQALHCLLDLVVLRGHRRYTRNELFKDFDAEDALFGVAEDSLKDVLALLFGLPLIRGRQAEDLCPAAVGREDEQVAVVILNDRCRQGGDYTLHGRIYLGGAHREA